jgi:adenine-specific DNA methylase
MTTENEITRTKQQLGAYYTPPAVAKLLTDWAVTSPDDTLLDPSFGGCAFLYAALDTLRALNVQSPGKQIFGTDIDPNAKGYLSPLFEAGASRDQFLIKNFFEVLPLEHGFHVFNCIVGNPPYINYHNIEKAEQKLAVARLKEAGIKISGRASSWAYFLLHSLRFLKHGGRMAMVLPGSFTRADYATEVRRLLALQFAHVYIVFLRERVFEDTSEQAVILLAQGFGEHEVDNNVSALEVSTVKELRGVLQNIQRTEGQPPGHEPLDNLYLELVHPEVRALLRDVQAAQEVIRLGDWANVRIGVVTGGNRFFVMSKSKSQTHEIPDEFLCPIVTKPARLTGLFLKPSDVTELLERDVASLLLSVEPDAVLPDTVQHYIDGAPDKVKNATKCKEREPWYSVLHRFNPPAFFQYMSATWPRITVNSADATCTNNIHRLLWKNPRCTEDWTRLALGALSTMSQLSAELLGRSYGIGVLKLEPKEVLKLTVPVGDKLDCALAEQVDALLRKGDIQEANRLVDAQLLERGLGLSKTQIQTLREARDYLQSRRRA